MFSDSTSRSSGPEVLCKKDVLKNFAILTEKRPCWVLFLTLLKETPAQVFSYEYCEIFKNSFFFLWWLLLNFFTESQKETVFSINRSVMRTFKCPFPVDLAFNMSIRCSERTTQPETIFFSVDFLVVITDQYFLFVYMQEKLI